MTAERVHLARSKNNVDVWYDSAASHAATHIHDTPHLDTLAAGIIQDLDLVGPYLQFHTDMGYVVGEMDLVENEPSDDIVYAKRLYRDTYSSFNKSKPPQPCSLVTIALERQKDDTYELVSAWIGPSNSPSFPGTERETADSKVFWSTHSLAWGNQAVQADTITTKCPW